MEAYAHKADKSKVDIGSVLTAPDGTEFYFDVQNGEVGFNTDPNRGSSTFVPFGGKKMKCVKFGTTTPTSAIDITDLGFESQEDYFILLDSGAAALSGQDSGYGSAAYISAKTATSFTIATNAVYVGTPAPTVSYQVISLVE